jgi:hypothetical protein
MGCKQVWMTLDQYLKLPGSPTAAEFGARCNPPLSEASISRIRRGEQNISRSVMLSIIEASDGIVTADGLVRADQKDRAA